MAVAAFWIAVAAFIVVGALNARRGYELKHQTIRLMLEKGEKIDDSLFRELIAPPRWHTPRPRTAGGAYTAMRVTGTLALFVAPGIALLIILTGRTQGNQQQQVFLRAWRSLRQLVSLDAFNGWLKQVMVSVWIDETRRERTAVRGSAELTDGLEPCSRPTQGMELDLEWALSFLEPRTRLCVLLAYGEGHSHGEISTLLDIPLGTAKSLVTRGAGKMRALLDDYRKD